MALLEGPDEDQMAAIRRELREDPARFEHNLGLFRQWVSRQAHLPAVDERLLPVFLRGCRHDLARAQRKLELYFGVRRTWPELYARRDPLEGARALWVVPLPKLTREGRRLTVARLTADAAGDLRLEHVVRHIVMVGDVRVHEEAAIAGDVYVVDLAGRLTLPQCARVAAAAPHLLRRAFALATEAYPQRVHAVHVINAPPFVDAFLGALRPLMKEKVRDRWIVHRDLDSLHARLEREVLPGEYGGGAGALADLHAAWQRALHDRAAWFRRQESVQAVGPLPEHLAHSCALHQAKDSVPGSFRKLAID